MYLLELELELEVLGLLELKLLELGHRERGQQEPKRLVQLGPLSLAGLANSLLLVLVWVAE